MYDFYEDNYPEYEYFMEDHLKFDYNFADPGGESALRAETPNNPRNLPCPTCGWPNRLTPADQELGYQCDSCAHATETGSDIFYYHGAKDEEDEDYDEEKN